MKTHYFCNDPVILNRILNWINYFVLVTVLVCSNKLFLLLNQSLNLLILYVCAIIPNYIMIIFSRWQAAMVVACTTHVLLFFSSLTFSLFLLHSHISSSVIVDMFVYGRGATKQERCQVRFRSPQLVVDLYRREL